MKIKANFLPPLSQLWVLPPLHIAVNRGELIGLKIHLLGYRSRPFRPAIINNGRWQ